MNNLEIRRVQDPLDLRRLRTFMLKQPQYYPDYGDWVNCKCIPRIEQNVAKAFVLLVDGRVAGDVVFHEEAPGTHEIKNLRIDPAYRNRAAGSFLLRQVETEVVHSTKTPAKIVTDVSTPNFVALEFFIRSGYKITDMKELYRPGQYEYLIEKPAPVLAS